MRQFNAHNFRYVLFVRKTFYTMRFEIHQPYMQMRWHVNRYLIDYFYFFEFLRAWEMSYTIFIDRCELN